MPEWGIHSRKSRVQPWGTVLRADIATTRVRPPKGKDIARHIFVVTPPGYNDAANATVRYPVVYLLHGSPGLPTNFILLGHWPAMLHDLVVRGEACDALFVMPDGNYSWAPHGDSEWVNSADGRDLYEDFVVKDVVGWADSHLRTIADPSHRVLGGVSEGAYGAVNIAMRNPTVFGTVLSMSGYFHNDGSGWARPIMGHDPEFLRQNSPLDYALGGLGAGRDPSAWRKITFILGAGADEKHYVTETREMAEEMKDVGVPVTLNIDDGRHGWGLWDQLWADAIPLVPCLQRGDTAR